MHSTGKFSLKYVSILFILGMLGVGTYSGHIKIQEKLKILNTIEMEICEIVSTTKTNDTRHKWHNNWQYTYNNETYMFTDETKYEPEEYSCCFEKLNPHNMVDCHVNNIKEYIYSIWHVCGLLVF